MGREHMDHSGMDHGGMDHGGMDMGSGKCDMNMLFTWSTTNLCIIFRQWRVSGPITLILSLLGVAILTAGYEAVRQIGRNYEKAYAARLDAISSRSTDDHSVNETSSLLLGGKESKKAAERQGTLIKGALYSLQVFYSFFIMLLFMTYNGWIMLAVAVGAFAGYVVFGSDSEATKSVACH